MTLLRHLALLLTLFLSPALVAQEICDNGLDDDGDGLVDLNDTEDCNCAFTASPESLLPNPSFEFFDGNNEGCFTVIPGGFPDNSSQAGCLTGWQAVNDGTTDAWNVTAVTSGSLSAGYAIPRPLPSGTGLASFIGYSKSNLEEFSYREYLGACTTNGQTINAGQAYRLSLQLGILATNIIANGIVSLNYDEIIYLAVYGVRDCEDLVFPGTGCPEESGATGYELITTISLPPTLGWNTVTEDFVPTSDYSAMVFGWPCGNEIDDFPTIIGSNYFHVDDLRVSSLADIQANENSPGGPIGVQGEALCDDDFLLLGRAVTGAIYQWYRNGIAISGATEVNHKPVTAGDYQLRTTAPQGCSVSDVVFVQLPYIPTRILGDTLALCGRDSAEINAFIPTLNATYLWDDGSTEALRNIGAPGLYTVTITTPCEIRVSSVFASATATPSFTVSLSNENDSCLEAGERLRLTINSDFDNLFFLVLGPDGSLFFNDVFSVGTQFSLSAPYPEVLLFRTQDVGCDVVPQIVRPNVAEGLTVSAAIEPIVCRQGSGRIALSVPDGEDFDYTWTSADGLAVGTNSPNLVTSEPGAYTVLITETGGCDFTGTYIIPSVNPVTSTVLLEERNCGGENTVQLILAGTRGEVLTEWFDEADNLVAVAVTEQQNLPPGGYRIEISDDFGCTATKGFRILGPTEALLSIEAVPTEVCGSERGSIAIDIPDGRPGLLVRLNDAAPVRSDGFSDLPAGIYLIEVTDADACLYYRDSVEIVRQEVAEFVLSSSEQILRLGEATQLRALFSSADADVNLAWSPTESLTCGDCPNPVASPLVTTTYVFTAGLGACAVVDSLTVVVSPGAPYYLPTAFSPNGDGVNDNFRLFASAGVAGAELEVYNRWGGQVYAGEGFISGWDGMFRGRPAAGGVYWYSGRVRLVNGITLEFKGAVTLLP